MKPASQPQLEILATGFAEGSGPDSMRPIVILPSGPDNDQPLEDRDRLDGSILVHVGAGACSVRDRTDAESVGLGSLDWHAVSGWKIRVRGEQQPELAHTLREQTDWAAPQIKIFPAPDSSCKVPLQCKLPTEEGEEFVVGRGNERTDLPLEDRHISRAHLRFTFRDGRHFVEDLQSSHGTKVNGAEIGGAGPVALEDEDEILIGRTKIRYVSYLCGLLSYETFAGGRRQEETPTETRQVEVAAVEPSETPGPKASETPDSATPEEPPVAPTASPRPRRFDLISFLMIVGVALALVALFCLLQYDELLEWFRGDE